MPLREPRNQLKALLLTLIGLFLAAEAAILWTGYKTIWRSSKKPAARASDCGPAPVKANALESEKSDACAASASPLNR